MNQGKEIHLMAEYGSLRLFLGLSPSPMVTSRARSGREGEKAKREQSKDRVESEGEERERGGAALMMMK